MRRSLSKYIPNFSDKNYRIASYICGILMLASSGFFIYEMFNATDFGINVNWNLFTSAWFGPLYVVGLILAIVNWGKFGHWGGQPYDVYKDSYGNKYTKRNDDIIENMFAHIIMPLLGHFLIEPVIYACIIYYPLMCCFALLDIILPYALTVLLLGLSIVVFVNEQFIRPIHYRSLILISATLVATGGLSWVSWSMHKERIPSVEYSSPESSSQENDDMFNDSIQEKSSSDPQEEIDEMFQ